MVVTSVIDFVRALETAWQRMAVILFQPFDFAKWGPIGFSAFLALMAEGGVSFNNPIPSNSHQPSYQNYSTYSSVPEALRAFKQFRSWLDALPSDPWLKVYVCLALAYIAFWLVLTWVGCRGEFLFLDNIVRNRAALAEPWRRYAWQGNVWFLFHLALILVGALFTVVSAGLFLYFNWTWIDAARSPNAGEIAALVLTGLVFLAGALAFTVVKFLIRSLVLPLYFKQTMSLGTALLAVMTLVFTRPISLFVYVLLNFAIAIAAALVTVLVCAATFCLTCWASCFPFIGPLLFSMVLCQLILPVLVFQRCFQLGCLEQFGPDYNVFTVDVPPLVPGQPPATT